MAVQDFTYYIKDCLWDKSDNEKYIEEWLEELLERMNFKLVND